nr:MAG TPA: hypothetical protein [Caudoviricetes sp.]
MPNSSDSIGAISIFVSPSFANSDNRLTCCSVHLVMSATSLFCKIKSHSL